jgi:hypothetical protein
MADLPNVDADEIARIRAIAESSNDRPVLMLNLNRYTSDAGYPDGDTYTELMAIVTRVASDVGGRILWRTPVHGHVVGNADFDEVWGVWYPSHKAFLDLMTLPGQEENVRVRAMAIKDALLLRCDTY